MKLKPVYEDVKDFKCNDLYCVTCKYIRETSSLNFKNLLLPILSNSNCNSPGIIYIISCNKCNIHYIGESKRKAKDRFAEHLKNILNFKYNIKNSIMNFSRKSEVAIHFNCFKHILNEDLDFYIINNNLLDDLKRRSKETDLMHILKIFKINILNKKIPDKKYITNLFFV